MTSKMPSKQASEPQPTLSPQLQHRGKPRYFLVDLQRALHSNLLLCSRLLSSLPSESSKLILISSQTNLQQTSKQLDDHLISLQTQTSLSSQEDPPSPT